MRERENEEDIKRKKEETQKEEERDCTAVKELFIWILGVLKIVQ